MVIDSAADRMMKQKELDSVDDIISN